MLRGGGGEMAKAILEAAMGRPDSTSFHIDCFISILIMGCILESLI